MSTETTEAAPVEATEGETQWSEAGNPLGDDPSMTAAMARAMEDAAAAEGDPIEAAPVDEPEPAPEGDEPAVEPPVDEGEPADEAPPDEPAVEAKPPPKTSEEMWAIRDARRKMRQELEELQALKAQLSQRAEEPQQPATPAEVAEAYRLMQSGQTAKGVALLAKATGKTPDQVYLDLTNAQLNPEPETPQQLDPKALLEQAKAAALAEFQEQQKAAKQEQHQRFLQTRVHELTAIGKHAELAKQFPYLASYSEAKLLDEMQSSVRQASQDPRLSPLLDDSVGFARKLNDLARGELEHQVREALRLDPEGMGRILSAYGYRQSAKPDGNGTPSKPDGPQTPPPSAAKGRADMARTVTTADTQTDGALRERTEEEKMDALVALFASS